jgi:hypothetical protein
LRIVASRTKPLFIVYGQSQQANDNELSIYYMSGCK